MGEQINCSRGRWDEAEVDPATTATASTDVAAGGCGGGGLSEADIEATIEARVKERFAAIPTPTLAANQILPDDSEAFNAEITRVIDGDTFDVVFADGSLDTVRLLGVDTPETYVQNLPYEYGDITDTVCLDDWGHRATEFAVNALENKSVTLVLDPMAGEKGSYGRLLAYVLVDGQDFGSALVTEGYARVYEEGVSGLEQDYLWLQIQAQSEWAGLWGCAVAEIVIPAMPPTATPLPIPTFSRSCCKTCIKGKACGNTCISRSYTCHKGPGCACNG